jgi:hypothetical protein
MSELLQQPFFLKDLRQPFFLKESPSTVGNEPHLARMTLGARHVEFQVPELFDREAEALLGRMQGVGPAGVTSLAHMLTGSARGIGAWRVAEAAEAVQRAAAEDRELASALQTLDCAVIEARLAICAMLRIQLSPRWREVEGDRAELESVRYDATLIRRPCEGGDDT